MREASRRALGFSMLGGVIVLWVGSSAALQKIFGADGGFRKPVFVTLFNSATSALLLLPRLARSCLARRGGSFHKLDRGGGFGDRGKQSWGLDELDGSPQAVWEEALATARLSGSVGLLWLCSQWVFNMSLLHTSVATNTVLSSTSSVFTFLFSLLICGDPFRWRSFLASMASFLGCTLVALQPAPALAADAVATSAFGEALATASAAMFALASVLLRRLAPGDLDTGSYMGMNGLLAMGLSPALLFAAHGVGLEPFRPPSLGTLLLLGVNAFVGCTCANYLYTSALLLLSPLVTSVCLSLSIPVSALFDEVLLQQHRFSLAWALGASLAAAGAALAAADLEAEPPQRADRQQEEALEELQSLLGAGGCEEGAEERGGS